MEANPYMIKTSNSDENAYRLFNTVCCTASKIWIPVPDVLRDGLVPSPVVPENKSSVRLLGCCDVIVWHLRFWHVTIIPSI